MGKKNFSPSVKLKNEWPEIFGDISSTVVPIKYVNNITIRFSDGSEWEICISENFSQFSSDSDYLHLDDLLDDYENEILDIDFDLDIIQFKKDMMISINKLN